MWGQPPLSLWPDPEVGPNTLGPSLSREPVVSPGGDAQLPAGLQLGACVQQRVPSVRGAPGPGLGARGGGDRGAEGRPLLWGFGMLRVPPSPRAGGWALTRSVFQVWIIANKVPGSHGLSRGTVCHRTGVQPREPKGQGWDYGIGVSEAYAGRLTWPGAAWSHRMLWDLVSGWVGGPRQSSSRVLDLPQSGSIVSPLDLRQPRVTRLSPSRGAGITSPSGPMPPEPSRAGPRRQPVTGVGSRASPARPRGWPEPRTRPTALFAADAALLT